MAQLQPRSQEVERVGPVITLSITAWVLLFGVLLCAVAAVVLTVRDHTLTRAASMRAPERPDGEVSNVRSELFHSRTAGEQLGAAQRMKLERFGWVDREQGMISMPIDLAMDLELQEAQP